MGFLTCFVKNDEIRPSLSYKIVLEQREERNQLSYQLLGTNRDLFFPILERKMQRLEKNVSPTFFKFQSILTYSVSGQRH